MTIATKYNPTVAWRTLALNVFQLTRETTQLAATYRVSVKAIDTNEPGANKKDTTCYLIDYYGTPYSIIFTRADTVDVRDDFRTGHCPISGKNAIIYKSAFKGKALYLSADNYRHLHTLALGNSHKYDMAILWANDPNPKKIPFTATAMPGITNYQTDQADPEDGTKTINYAEQWGEMPVIRCMITVDGVNRYQKQQDPQFTYVDGLISTLSFDLGTPLTGYLIISR